MFKELATHNYLGSINEFRFLFDSVLYCDKPIKYFDIDHQCRKKPFLFRNGTKGILEFLVALDFIDLQNDGFLMKCKKYNLQNNKNLSSIVIDSILNRLMYFDEFNLIFDETKIEFDEINETYTIRSYYISPQLNNLKRFLIDIGFLKIDATIRNSLMVQKSFIHCFEEYLPKRSKKKLPLSKLKELNDLNEKLGKEAEIYVLQLEQNRLKGHEFFAKIVRISEENTSAGYDIESFESNDSKIIDRFIEVKSYSKDIKFFWSRPEVEVAKKLKTNYCLCLVDRDRMRDENYMPDFIFNPYQEIFSSNEVWDKRIESWLIKHRKI
jgi:hypothetical protein